MGQAEAWLDRRRAHVGIAALALGLGLSSSGDSATWLCPAAAALLTGALGRAPRAALIAAVALAAGGAGGAARTAAIDASGERLGDGSHVAGIATLLERPAAGPLGSSAEVQMVSGQGRGTRLLLRAPHGLAEALDGAAAGAELALAGEVRHPRSEGDGLDFATYLRARGVAGELHVDRLRQTGGVRGGLAGGVDRVRERSARAIGAGLPSDGAALARAMVLGDDEEVGDSVREDFRDSGLAHVMAVSGQNVALLCMLAIPVLAALGLPRAARTPALAALIALYVPLAGAGPSIQRAGVMGVASLAAVALARPPSRWYALGLAACVTLALQPRAWGDPGWQLSFAAVAGILLLAPGVGRSLSALPRLLADGIALALAATVATAPLLALHFDAVSLAALPANVAALPLVAPIMWLGMLRAALGQLAGAVGPAAVAEAANGLVGVPLELLVRCLADLAALFADAPGSRLSPGVDGPLEVAIAYAVIATGALGMRAAARRWDGHASTAVAYVRRLPRRARFALALAALMAIALLAGRGLVPPGPPTDLTVSFLDVGQGDATLVQHPGGATVLFDGGPPEGGVARLLRRAGVRRLSLLVMTHASRDHHGGLAEVVDRVPVDVLLDGGDGTTDPAFRAVVRAAAARGTRIVAARAPLALSIGPLSVRVLSPPPRPPGPPPEDPNPRAVVSVVGAAGFDLLVSGDAESDALLPLGLPDVDAIKVPHHGSADPGLPTLLDELRPEIASIPVGPNAYGHPAPSTVAALRRAGATTWRNDRNGTVRIAVRPAGVDVRAERGRPVPGDP